MSVAEIAENVGLTEEQRTQISDLLQEYRKEVSKQMMSVFGGRVRVRQPGPNKDQPGSSKDKQNESGTEATPQPAPAPAPPSTPEEWRLRAEKASKQIEKTRKTLGEKALALLSPEQKQAWIEMQGRTFRFRLVD